MKTLQGYVLVFLGAGVGGALRHSVNLVSLRLVGPDLPVATLLVNILGSLSLGAVAGVFGLRGHGSHAMQLLVATGILGGFTTFSAFSLEAALLWERGQALSCVAYVLVSVLLSVIGVFVGLAVVR